MREFRDRFGLAFETGKPIGVLRHRLGQHLDRHIAIELLVVGAVDLPHPALADFFDDAIVAERATDEVLHCPGIQWANVIADWRARERYCRDSALPPSRQHQVGCGLSECDGNLKPR